MLSVKVKKLSSFSHSTLLTSLFLHNQITNPEAPQINPDAIPSNLNSIKKKLKLFPILNFKSQLSSRILQFKELSSYYFSQFRVKPKGESPLLQHETFMTKCINLGISYEESRKIVRFVEILDLRVPEYLNEEDIKELQEKFAFFKYQHKTQYREFLRDELKELEKQISPIKDNYILLKSQAETYADNWMTFGTIALLSQIASLSYYGVFFEALNGVQVSLAAAGLSTMCIARTSARESISHQLFSKRLARLSEQHGINLSRLALLQQEINQVRCEIISLN